MPDSQKLRERKGNSPFEGGQGDVRANANPIIAYNSHLKQNARRLRTHATTSEKRLWAHIRRRQRHGFRFLRQRPIGAYIVDFYAPELRLVIEVDGASHRGNLEADLERQSWLEQQGLHVLRFSDQQVLHDIENVVRMLDGWIEERTPNKTSP